MKWKKIKTWPVGRAEQWLGIPGCMVDLVEEKFQLGFIIEGFSPGPGFKSSEIRVKCNRGEIFPVGNDTWGWCGPGGLWTRRVLEATGNRATGPFSTGVMVGSREDESILWFSNGDFPAVAVVVGAKKRNVTWGISKAPPPKKRVKNIRAHM